MTMVIVDIGAYQLFYRIKKLIKMKIFQASLDTILLRYFLMMLCVIVPFLIGHAYLAIIAIPVFLSAIMAVDFTNKNSH